MYVYNFSYPPSCAIFYLFPFLNQETLSMEPGCFAIDRGGFYKKIGGFGFGLGLNRRFSGGLGISNTYQQVLRGGVKASMMWVRAYVGRSFGFGKAALRRHSAFHSACFRKLSATFLSCGKLLGYKNCLVFTSSVAFSAKPTHRHIPVPRPQRVFL